MVLHDQLEAALHQVRHQSATGTLCTVRVNACGCSPRHSSLPAIALQLVRTVFSSISWTHRAAAQSYCKLSWDLREMCLRSRSSCLATWNAGSFVSMYTPTLEPAQMRRRMRRSTSAIVGTLLAT